MSSDVRLSAYAASVALDALCRLLDGGSLRLYAGRRPSAADLLPRGTLLAELGFSSPAFAPATGGIAEARPLTPEPEARASGRASWYRCLSPAGLAVLDGSVGTENASMVLTRLDVEQGSLVAITSFLVQLPLERR